MSSWQFAAFLMLGGSTLLLFIGMPVALTFLSVNIVGLALHGRRARFGAACAKQCQFGGRIFSHAHSFVCLDG